MYKCVSFYSANRMLQERQSAVIAAWSVVADEYYHYDMKIDELGYPRALCLIRTIEGRGRIQTEEGEILLSEKEFILLKRRDCLLYTSLAPKTDTPVVRMAKFIAEVSEKKPFIRRIYPQVRAMFEGLCPYMAFPMRLIFANLWLFAPLLKTCLLYTSRCV